MKNQRIVTASKYKKQEFSLSNSNNVCMGCDVRKKENQRIKNKKIKREKE